MTRTPLIQLIFGVLVAVLMSGCGNKGDLVVIADQQTVETIERLEEELDNEEVEKKRKEPNDTSVETN